MRKTHAAILHDLPKARRNRFATAVKLSVIALLAPLIFEGSMICLAQWKSMYGPIEVARTPVLDFLSASIEQAGGEMGRRLALPQGQPWKPSVVIPATIAWTGLAVFMLRRC